VSREVRVQDLLGRQVRAANNQSVGRIEEIRVEKHGKGYVVREFHLGAAALLERLSAHLGSWFGRSRQVRVAAWDEIDLGDPKRPRLLVEAGALRRRDDDQADRLRDP
jgi:hypothetical protein